MNAGIVNHISRFAKAIDPMPIKSEMIPQPMGIAIMQPLVGCLSNAYFLIKVNSVLPTLRPRAPAVISAIAMETQMVSSEEQFGQLVSIGMVSFSAQFFLHPSASMYYAAN